MPADAELTCPSCDRRFDEPVRICPDCGVPLRFVQGDEVAARSEEHARARKIRPQYTRGEPVAVAYARNQAESELIQGLLLEEGIPSIERRARGFDVPDFLAAGPRSILVPASAEEAARALLDPGGDGTGDGAGAPAPGGGGEEDVTLRGPAVRILAGMLVVAMLGTGLAALIRLLTG